MDVWCEKCALMQAVVFHHPGKVPVQDAPDPGIEAADDTIVRFTATFICGSERPRYNGLLPQERPSVPGLASIGAVLATRPVTKVPRSFSGIFDRKGNNRVMEVLLP